MNDDDRLMSRSHRTFAYNSQSIPSVILSYVLKFDCASGTFNSLQAAKFDICCSTSEDMAQRAAKELRDGYYVNLGIGIPTLVSNFFPPGMTVQLQLPSSVLRGLTEDEMAVYRAPF